METAGHVSRYKGTPIATTANISRPTYDGKPEKDAIPGEPPAEQRCGDRDGREAENPDTGTVQERRDVGPAVQVPDGRGRQQGEDRRQRRHPDREPPVGRHRLPNRLRFVNR